jgi:DNA-directed RNA polymerase subunit RPC12/RpoP
MKYDLCVQCGHDVWMPTVQGYYNCYYCGTENPRHIFKQRAKKVLMLLSKLGVGGPARSDEEPTI